MALPLEKLTLRAKAINAGFGITEAKGDKPPSRFAAIGFEIVDDETYNGETITALMYFTEKTSARTIESIQHMGFQGDDLSLLEDIGPEKCAELLPSVVEIVCEPEEYDGNWTLKVRWVNRVGAGRFKAKQPLVGAELKAFAAQMKGALRNARGGAPKQNGSAPKTTPHPNAPGSTDDIPFASADMDHEPSPIALVIR